MNEIKNNFHFNDSPDIEKIIADSPKIKINNIPTKFEFINKIASNEFKNQEKTEKQLLGMRRFFYIISTGLLIFAITITIFFMIPEYLVRINKINSNIPAIIIPSIGGSGLVAIFTTVTQFHKFTITEKARSYESIKDIVDEL